MSDYLMRMATRAQAMQMPLSAPPLQAFVRSKSPIADQDQRLQVPGFEDLASPFLSTSVTTPPEEHASTTSGIPIDVAIQRKIDASTAASPGISPLAPADTTTSINDPSPVLAQPHNHRSHTALPVTEMTGIDPASQVKLPGIEPRMRSEAADLRMPRQPEPIRPWRTTEQTSMPDTLLEPITQVRTPYQTIEHDFVDTTNIYNLTEVQQETQLEPGFPPASVRPNELIPSARPMLDLFAHAPLREPEPSARPEPRPETGKGEAQAVEKITQQTTQIATQAATAASISVIGPLNREVPIHRRLSLRYR